MMHPRVAIAAALIIFSVGSVSQEAGAGPVFSEGGNSQWDEAKTLEEYACKGKGVVAAFAITSREEVSEKEVLEILEGDWEESYKPAGVKFSTYVDMQRIVRDVMRKNKDGSWAHYWDDDSDIQLYAENEVVMCYANGF